MMLAEYMETRSLKPGELAKLLGKSPSYVTRLLDPTDGLKPSLSVMGKITEITGGLVQVEDILNAKQGRN